MKKERITVTRTGVVTVLAQHVARISVSPDDSFVLFGSCPCGWKGNEYPSPYEPWDDHPTRVQIREEIYNHLFDALQQEAKEP